LNPQQKVLSESSSPAQFIRRVEVFAPSSSRQTLTVQSWSVFPSTTS
jgi:hypothetical protein